MLTLILVLILGSLLVYISGFNFTPVSVNLGFYIFQDVPLFYVIVASLLVGLLLSYLVYLLHTLSHSFTLKSKEKEIEKHKEEILELTKRVHQLELDLEKQKNSTEIEPTDKDAL